MPSPEIDVEGKVLICGGGIGGLALGAALAKIGVPFVILERGEQLRSAGAGIRLQTNAWHAMEQLGVADALRKDHMKMERYEVVRNTGHALCGGTYRDDEENRGVVRNEIILQLAELIPTDCLFLGCGVQSAKIDDQGNGTVTLLDGTVLRPKVLVGADGVNSRVAKALGLAGTSYSGYVGIRAIARFEDGIPGMERVTLAIVGGPEGHFDLLFPLNKNIMYYASCFSLPQSEVKSFTGEKALTHLKENAKNLDPKFRMPLWISKISPDEVYAHQLADRVPAKDKPWGRGTVTALGDAAHATTPFLGQGGAMAMEDAVELAVALQCAMKGTDGKVPWDEVSPESVATALRQYEMTRAPRTHDMVKLARFNANVICLKRTWLGVWLRDVLIQISSVLTGLSFYAKWKASAELKS